MTRYLVAPAFLAAVAFSVAMAPSASAQLVDGRATLARYAWLDNRDVDWFAARIPFFESPDSAIDATYYYRWEVVTKHLTYGSPQTGYTFTEFIDHPFWSGTHGAISCPLGHQFYEVRWLKDRRIIDDFARYWFETPGAQPRSYSNWYGDAMWATYLVLGDRRFIGTVLPYMKRQYDGWLKERYDSAHGLFHWDGLHDGMEQNINSRQTDNPEDGADGYRPTLNSYLFADARAISRASALFGDTAAARLYAERAAAIKRRVQEELWDHRRQFFLHQSARDEIGGIKAKTRTYDSGKYAGSPHGRELIGYVPWQFGLPDSAYVTAWRYLMDTAYFAAPFGPTTAERGDPMFYVSPRCCFWSGNSWPFATTQTLVAMANLLNDYQQSIVTRRDWMALLQTYTRTQRKDGKPYVAEAANPFTGSWEGHDLPNHSEHYFHSGYVDLIVTGLVGLRPRADDTLEVNPLAPDEWPYWALDGVSYHGRTVSILWDRDGTRYGKGRGLTILANGQVIANAPQLGRLKAYLGPPRPAPEPDRRVNLAVNDGLGPYPWVTASYSAPATPANYVIDGAYRYMVAPPNRWTDSGSVNPRESLVLDFGIERPVEELALYFLDDGEGSTIRAPARYDIEVWDGRRWVPAPVTRRDPAEPTGHRANRVTFARPLWTSRLRVVLDHRPGSFVGLTELETWASGVKLPLAPPRRPPPSLAYNSTGRGFPKVSASFTGKSDRAAEATDLRVAFTRYSRNRWTAFGTANASDWLEVDFGSPKRVELLELYLFGDDRGVRAPRRYTVQHWDGTRWTDARIVSQLPERPTASAVNAVRIAPVRTAKVRVVFEHDLPAVAGVTELVIR